MTTKPETRELVLRWISEERARYADATKYATNTVGRDLTVDSVRSDGVAIFDFIYNYVKRAQLLGLTSEPGRQALGKAIVTCLHTLETAVEEHGQMPEPGHPSGTINPWLDAESSGLV